MKIRRTDSEQSKRSASGYWNSHILKALQVYLPHRLSVSE